MVFCHSKKQPSRFIHTRKKLIYKNTHTTIGDISVNSINCRKIPAMYYCQTNIFNTVIYYSWRRILYS